MIRAVLTTCMLLAATVTAADWSAVREAWSAGDVHAARDLLAAMPAEDLTSVEGGAWASLLASRPELADSLSAVDEAWIAWGRGDAQGVVDAVAVPGVEPSSGHGLLLGLARLRLGDADAARESLAGVRPADPGFSWARYLLGRLAVEDGDPVLARRYYRNAEEADRSACRADVLAAVWELSRDTDPREATRLRRELMNRFPDSLAMMRVLELERRRDDAEQRFQETEVVEAAPAPAVDDARFTLQLGAFGDRGRALGHRDRCRAWLDPVEVEEIDGADGRTLYRVRGGRFASRTHAAERAAALSSEHGVEAVVVERSADR